MSDKPTIVKGIKKFYAAKVLIDNGTILTHDIPKYFKGIQELATKIKSSRAVLRGEGDVMDSSDTVEEIGVDILLASLTSEEEAFLLGHEIDAQGGIISKATDQPPLVAILFKAVIPGGFRYGVLYCGKFMISDDTMKQEDGKPEYQAPKLSGTFYPAQTDGILKYKVDTTDPGCPENIDETFFANVYLAESDTVAPTVTCVPADDATGVVISANTVLTFSKAMDESTCTAENIILVKADGTAVPAAMSFNADKEVLTIDPTANMSAATDYLVIVTEGAKSATGVPIAARTAFKFTTA